MSVARAVAKRSDCSRAQVGAVIVDASNRIVATGFNGSPAGFAPPCIDVCERAKKPVYDLSPDYSDCIAIHAEANALLFCDRRDRLDGVIYVTGAMCYACAKLVANSGLAGVVMDGDGSEHRSVGRSLKMLTETGLWARVI